MVAVTLSTALMMLSVDWVGLDGILSDLEAQCGLCVIATLNTRPVYTRGRGRFGKWCWTLLEVLIRGE